MVNNKRSIFFSLLCLLVASVLIVGNTAPVFAGGDFSHIDGYLTAAVKRHNIPGMALAIAQGDQISFSKGYGAAGKRQAMTPDTPLYIGSQSKSFTALAIMQLVEQEKLELDAPVQAYLPWFRVADDQASQKITVRHLLQHSSGLSESGYMPALPPEATLEMLVRDLSRARLTAPVGTKMQYFNPGYSILGLLVETASGQSYGDYLSEHVFTPLKMANTFTDPALAKAAGLSQGYAQIFMFAAPLEQPVNRYDLPAGYIISSANDMARYLMALTNNGELEGARVLKPENVQMLFTPNTAIQSTYGFGWYISDAGGEKRITHGGDTERFHTGVLILPERDTSFVLLINENHLLKDFNEYNAIFNDLSAMLTGDPLPNKTQSSLVFGWGLFALWIFFLALAARKVIRFPQWRIRASAWDSRRRRRDILSHLLSIGITVLIVVFVAPAFLKRGFSWKWFVGFLPDVALIIGTLIVDDIVQMVMKLSAAARVKAV